MSLWLLAIIIYTLGWVAGFASAVVSRAPTPDETPSEAS